MLITQAWGTRPEGPTSVNQLSLSPGEYDTVDYVLYDGRLESARFIWVTPARHSDFRQGSVHPIRRRPFEFPKHHGLGRSYRFQRGFYRDVFPYCWDVIQSRIGLTEASSIKAAGPIMPRQFR